MANKPPLYKPYTGFNPMGPKTTVKDGIKYNVNPSSGNMTKASDMFAQGLNAYRPKPGNTGLTTMNESSRNFAGIDTSEIDFTNKDQVMQIQEAIGADVDGIWGPQTEKMYREAIKSRREGAGMDAYMYDTPTGDSSANSNQNPILQASNNTDLSNTNAYSASGLAGDSVIKSNNDLTDWDNMGFWDKVGASLPWNK